MEKKDTPGLTDPSAYPDEGILRNLLGPSWEAWVLLTEGFGAMNLVPEWRFYKDGSAWLCKVLKGKKNLLWISPFKQHFQGVLYFSERHLERILELGLTDGTKERIRTADPIGKLRTCIVDVRGSGDLPDLEALLALKTALK